MNHSRSDTSTPDRVARHFEPTRLLPWVLAIIGILVYVNILPNEFVFDDTPAVARAEIESWDDFVTTLGRSGRPVADLTIMANHAIDGDQPMGYRLLNIVIHVLAAMTLFGIVRRILDLPTWSKRVGGRGPGLAFAIALLWLVHPLNTQAVSYMVQRHESLMGLFYLFTIYALIRCADAQRAGLSPSPDTGSETGAGRTPDPGSIYLWGATAVLACALGMGTKQVMVGAPIVALLIDRCFLAGSFIEAFKRRWGLYLGLAATWGWVAWLNLGGLTAEESSAGFKMELLTPGQYFLSQGEVIAWYLRLAFWPSPLVLDYQVHWIPATIRAQIQGPIAWLPGVAFIGVLFLAGLYGVIRNRWWGACAVWFFLILGVTSSFLPIADIAFEHRMYLPLIAVIAMVVIGFDALLNRIATKRAAIGIGAAWLAVVAVTLGALTIQRNFEYATKISIWDSVVLRAENNPRGWHNLGSALSAANRAEEALFAFDKVLMLNPNYDEAHNNIGNIYLDVHGRPDMAIERYARAAEIKPGDPDYRYNLGRAYLQVDELDRSIDQSNEAISLRPDYPKAHSNLGIALAKSGRTDEAIESFRTAIQQDPEMIDAYQNLSAALASQQRFAEAADVVEQALALARQMGAERRLLTRIEERLAELRTRASAPTP